MTQDILPKHIFLFGHRKQHGKDTCCDLLEEYCKKNRVSYHRTLFAKSLKKQCTIKYGLDFNQMESDDYKNSKPNHLNGKSIRDVLIDYGLSERKKDPLVFCKPAYSEIFKSKADIAFISDFRFPNEGNSCSEIYYWCLLNNVIFNPTEKPKVHKILVHRPYGKFVSDGADDQIPDIDYNYWDHVIINQDIINWKDQLEIQLLNYITKFTEI